MKQFSSGTVAPPTAGCCRLRLFRLLSAELLCSAYYPWLPGCTDACPGCAAARPPAGIRHGAAERGARSHARSEEQRSSGGGASRGLRGAFPPISFSFSSDFLHTSLLLNPSILPTSLPIPPAHSQICLNSTYMPLNSIFHCNIYFLDTF